MYSIDERLFNTLRRELMTKKREIIDILMNTYGGAKCGLDFSTPFQLLVATILSAQCTDVRVNIVTPELFCAYPDPQSMSKAEILDVERLIRTCGFYKNKAKNIVGTSLKLCEQYDGLVPSTMEELTQLDGVGRKTANVVMANAYGIPAIAVDTHVFRVSNRLGLANAKNVEQTEMQLQKAIPKAMWSDMHHALIWHGRKVCAARKPKCEECNLSHLCKYYNKKDK